MIKKILIIVGIIIAVFLPALSYAATGERVVEFSGKYEVLTSATLIVQEKIKYDFGNQNGTERHGIYRVIPTAYRISSGENRLIKITDYKVTDGSGKKIKYQITQNSNDVNIKVGDANIHVSGVQEYIISYRVEGATNYFSDYDELYWNVTGNGWDFPIDKATAEFTYPAGTTSANAKLACYAGPLNSNNNCDVKNVADNSGRIVATVEQKNLNANEGLTFVAGFPKSLIDVKDPIKKGVGGSNLPSWVVWMVVMASSIIPIITFIIMFTIWLGKGKDPKGKGAIVTQFDPPKGMTPIEVGAITTDKIENKLATAELIYLAEKGYIKITKVKKKILLFETDDYEIEKLKPLDDKLTSYDVLFFTTLFGEESKISVSDLKSSTTKNIIDDFKALKKGVFGLLTEKGYYKTSPYYIQKKYFGIAGGLSGAAFVIIWITSMQALPLSIGLFLSAGIVSLFGLIMPAKTELGMEQKEYVLGLKEYLSVAEKERLEFLNAPKAEPKRFEKLLPYAIALGVEKQWAKQFEGIYNGNPGWYSDSSGGAFNAIIFTNAMGDFNKGFSEAVFTSAAASGSSGFGGGGFSGGGFGGGGGGSW